MCKTVCGVMMSIALAGAAPAQNSATTPSPGASIVSSAPSDVVKDLVPTGKLRAAEIAFTAPYVLIEGVYIVRKDSPLHSIAEVDRPGVRIAVNKGSAYDLYLTRTIKHATLMRAESGIDLFVRDKLEVAAGVKQPIVEFAKTHADMRVMDGRFMEIRQAMGTPRARYQGRDDAPRYLHAFVEEMKASGFVAKALARSNQPDAAVAPAEQN